MPEFDAVFMAIALIKGDIENLGTQIKTLGTCLISKNPGTHLSTTNDLVGRINTAFAAANTTYSV
jgi:hypothetical protein